jgi:hypothetical protein
VTDEANLPFGEASPEAAISTAKPRKHRHQWITYEVFIDGKRELPDETRCKCGAIQDPAASRRGKSARNRGNAFEREVAAKLGGQRRGQYGGLDDVAAEWIVVQCKVGGAFPERIWRWLPPGNAGQLRAVVIGDAPGSSGKRRSLICLDLDDFVAWYGKP